MGETTAIAWCDHTRNFWTGCTKVSPGCDHCYAEAFQRRFQGTRPDTGEAKNWGTDAARVPYLEGAARDLRRWNKKAKAAGVKRRVFINSHSDFFDRDAPQAWRDFAFDIFTECQNLKFLLVTKRISNVVKMVPALWVVDQFPNNLRIMISVVNQEEADRDIPKLLALDCKNGISYEPALGAVDWEKFLCPQCDHGSVPAPGGGKPCPRCLGDAYPGCPGLQWIIVGGESDQGSAKARPFNIAWARNTIDQCRAAGVPVFVKQIGSSPRGWCVGNTLCDESDQNNDLDFCDLYDAAECSAPCIRRCYHQLARAGDNPAEWPSDLRIRQHPND